MPNTETTAATWVAHLAGHPDVHFGPRLQAHFEAGRITRLCACGCNSFDIEIPAASRLEPLGEPGAPGKVFEIAFESSADAEIAFTIFVDSRGYLSGIDVTCGTANHATVPDALPWVVAHRAVVLGTAAGLYGALSVARTLKLLAKAVQAEHSRHVAHSR